MPLDVLVVVANIVHVTCCIKLANRAGEPVTLVPQDLQPTADGLVAILIANEPRTALEAFLRALGRFDWCPLLAPCLDASSALWHVDCLPPSRQPCAAVALYQS